MFLYPTIAMYYLCFVSIWMSVQCLQLGILCLLTFINSFPIYLIFGYFFHTGIFIKSVYFEPIHSVNKTEFPTNYLNMVRQKHSFFWIFQEFLAGIQQQVFELVNFRTLKHVLIGTRIPRTVYYESKKKIEFN